MPDRQIQKFQLRQGNKKIVETVLGTRWNILELSNKMLQIRNPTGQGSQ